jgi:outer membrane protein OmpA-like peptidoglycan-associated protein
MTHPTLKRHCNKLLASCSVLSALLSALLLPEMSWAQVMTGTASEQTKMQVSVNSSADGPVQANSALTLREAIEVINGTLPLAALSAAEKQLVTAGATASEIRFNLPAGQTAIEIESVLPAIAQPGTTIDGTTQPGYDPSTSATAEIAVAVPIVTLRPARGKAVFRGLTLSADGITVKGLSLYGFNASEQITHSTPPADIFISHRPTPLNQATSLPGVGERFVTDTAPSGIVIEQNWLGLPPDETMPEMTSGFGVSVFDSSGTTIQHNRIAYHNGSGVITGRQADNLKVLENIIVGNGLSGMPDAIRLDGQVKEALISSNLICGNDGSGIFMFKPDGAVTVANNDIRYNGQRFRRAAVYVMGDDHRVVNNSITHQKGGGVVVTAFGQGPNTQSTRNVMTGNRFDALEGLSIDLNARRDRAPQDFQRGDGPNPQRNSHNRRQDTGNSAVNAPHFKSPEFFVLEGKVVVQGQADANSEIQLYRSTGLVGDYGPLTEPLQTATANEKGEFEFALDALVGGEVLSAIATDPRYGTSEPALNTIIRSLAGQDPTATPVSNPDRMPQCTTPPAPPVVTPPLAETSPAPAAVIRLEVPRNVHFALDEDVISAESKAVLDKIAATLKDYPSIVVELHGHTDSRASQAYNEDLARRRAENARRYLLSVGIGPERMTLRSLGETELLVEESDRANFARNRRVEFVFTDVRGADITFVNQEADLQVEP